MIKEIQLGGISATPDDYQSPDGDLDSAINLIPEDNHLKPLFPPSSLCTLPENCSVVFIHRTSSFTHYIILEHDADRRNAGNALHWVDSSNLNYRYIADMIVNYDNLPSHIVHDFGLRDVLKVSAIGNTILVVASDGLHYILWKKDSYSYLGQKPPLLGISFGTSQIKSDNYKGLNSADFSDKLVAFNQLEGSGSSYCSIDNTNHIVNIENIARQAVTECAWALINATNAKITEAGHFYAPFFVRYCYRLFDGSMYMHSAPIFIPLSSPYNFRIEFMSVYNKTIFAGSPGDLVFQSSPSSNDTYNVNNYDALNHQTPATNFNKFTLRYRPVNVALTCIADADALNSLRTNWADIVKSVDIFISSPLTREISDRDIESASPRYDHHFFYANNLVAYHSDIPWRRYYDAAILNGVPSEYFTAYYNVCLDIPLLSEADYLKKITDTSNFFRIHSYDLSSDSIPTDDFAEVPIPGDILKSLASQEPMSDDYHTHNSFLPAFDTNGRCLSDLFPYNNRLNISGVNEKLFQGFPPSQLIPSDDSASIFIFALVVHLNSDYADHAVLSFLNPSQPAKLSPLFLSTLPLFYPDSRAYAIDIHYYATDPRTDPSASILQCSVPMHPHPLLNGAITSPSLIKLLNNTLTPSTSSLLMPTSDMSIILSQNKLYTSEVNNPFLFPSSGINTISSGAILGISSAAKALSQGQFGQFPLYAFTSEGVWALEVASNGTFSARQPITRDVCSNPDGITQLDSAVLFPTARGLMLLSGSEAVCISDSIATEHPFDFLSLPSASHLHSLLGHPSDSCFPTQPFSSFLDGCRLLYDYLHQHIIVYNPSLSYAYVYSLKSKLWGMMHSSLSSSLNSYPDALAMDSYRHLVSFSSTDQSLCHTLLLTRPLKLDAHDSLKSIRSLILRGTFEKGDAQVVLYASRDLYHWHLVGSSTTHTLRHLRGTPYKYFRLAVIAALSPDKSIASLSIDADLRASSKLI